VRESNRSLLRKQSRWPDGQARRDGRNYRWRGRCDWRELRFWNSRDDWSHYHITRRIAVMIERRPDVSQHDSTCQRCCDRAKSEIALCGGQQAIVVTFPQTRREDFGTAGGPDGSWRPALRSIHTQRDAAACEPIRSRLGYRLRKQRADHKTDDNPWS